MVKQSRVITGSVDGASIHARAFETTASKRVTPVVARFKGLGRASAVVSVGLMAAFAAPRDAKALPVFTDNTAFSLGLASTTATQTTTQPCSDSTVGCWTNGLIMIDIDNDGDLDALYANGGGLFAPTSLPTSPDEAVVLINDSKGTFFDATAATAMQYGFLNPHGQARAVAAGDIDGDGDIDIYQPSGYGTELDRLFVQTSPGFFVDQSQPSPMASPPTTFQQLPAGLKSRAASAKFGDIDGDGDLDLLVADWGTGALTDTGKLILYQNDGLGTFTLLATQSDPGAGTATDILPPALPPTSATNPYYGARPTDVDFADIDGDYDLDILVNNRQGYNRILLNNGGGVFTDATNFVATGTTPDITSNYPAKKGPYANYQEVCDIDEDGDLDLLLDNAGPVPTTAPAGGGNNVSQILLNDGKGVFTDDSANRIIGEPKADDGAIRCVDINADGHYDIVVGSRTNGLEKLLLNDGTGVFTYQVDAFPKIVDTTLSVAVGDVNGDGRMDVITGQGEGAAVTGTTARLERAYLGTGARDTTPPVIRKMQTPVGAIGVPTVFYMEVRDASTNEAGQMVTVSVDYVANTSSKKTRTAAWMGGDLFRVTVPAQVDGTKLTITPRVVDRAGNVTTAATVVLQIGTAPPPSSGGAGGGGGRGGSGGTGGSIAAGGTGAIAEAGEGGVAGEEAGAAGEAGLGGEAGVVEAGGRGGSAPSPSEGGEAGSVESPTPGNDDDDDDGGCSIASVPVTKSRGAVLLGFGLSMVGLLRRRRNKH